MISDFTLNPPYAVLKETDPPTDAERLGFGLMWGIVIEVFETTDQTPVGTICSFEPKKFPNFTISGIVYWQVPEEFLSNKIIPAP